MTRRRPASRPLWPRLALAGVALLLAAGIAELLVRALWPQPLMPPWLDELNGVMANRPGVTGRVRHAGLFDVTTTITTQRFRGTRHYSPRPVDGTLRVVALGDSFTFGYGLADDETYPAVLEALLVSDPAPHPVEVINAGVPGTGTGHQVLWYDAWVSRFHPRLVILGVTTNDVDDDLRQAAFERGDHGRWHPRSTDALRRASAYRRRLREIADATPGYAFLAERSQFLFLARRAIGRAMIGRAEPAPPVSAAASPDDPLATFRDHAAEVLPAEITWLRERLSHSGARLVILYIPWREEVYASRVPWSELVKAKGRVLTAVLAQHCAAAGIPFLDSTPRLADRAASSGAPLFFAGPDTHPNRHGARAIAEILARFLAEQGLLHAAAR